MARTKREPSPEVMGDGAAWEFFAGRDSEGRDQWADAVAHAAPLFAWENRTGVVTMTFAPAAKLFLMVVGTPSCAAASCDGVGSMKGAFDFYVLSSPAITGPFTLVSYQAGFGRQAYFVNIPGALLDAAMDGDGNLGGYLSYSANFADKAAPNPAGSGYHWSLLRFRLARRAA